MFHSPFFFAFSKDNGQINTLFLFLILFYFKKIYNSGNIKLEKNPIILPKVGMTIFSAGLDHRRKKSKRGRGSSFRSGSVYVSGIF